MSPVRRATMIAFASPKFGQWRAGKCLAATLACVLAAEGVLFAAQVPLPAKVYRYADRLLKAYDGNGDGKLQKSEWQRMHGQPARVDANDDQVVTADELTAWIAAFGAQRKLRLIQTVAADTAESASSDRSSGQAETKPADGSSPASTERAKPSDQGKSAAEQAASPGPRRHARFHVPSKRLPPGLPPWFLQRDANGDGQVTLSEFAPKATAADRREFARYDLNGDGIATPQECTKNAKPAKPAQSETATP